jgi:hypothetical protein
LKIKIKRKSIQTHHRHPTASNREKHKSENLEKAKKDQPLGREFHWWVFLFVLIIFGFRFLFLIPSLFYLCKVLLWMVGSSMETGVAQNHHCVARFLCLCFFCDFWFLAVWSLRLLSFCEQSCLLFIDEIRLSCIDSDWVTWGKVLHD